MRRNDDSRSLVDAVAGLTSDPGVPASRASPEPGGFGGLDIDGMLVYDARGPCGRVPEWLKGAVCKTVG